DPVEIQKPIDRQVVVRQENLSLYDGEDGNNLKRFSVVIGSFQNPTNAKNLKERMQQDGYNPVLAKNDQGMLRVIVTSFNSREEAAASRDAIKQRYAPNFQDAWLLEKTN
ncbi:MAG: SPOR domain-containing protein, partial [Porphyromonadaceae bacterium]|nr:SPOR domain-containing protein [Porphyromonadaceae bacterium]